MKRELGSAIATAVAGTLLLGGCSGARIILPPDGPSGDPIRQLSVNFHPNFVAGSFRATLDGADITSIFPTPVPGGTSVANFTLPLEPTTASHLDVNSSVNPNSGFTLQDQRLSADFSGPHLRFYAAGSTTLPKNGAISVNVCREPTGSSPTYPMTVNLSPGVAAPVNINGAGLGASTNVTLNFSADPVRSCAPLTIQAGTVPGSWFVNARAPGVQRGVLSGSVL